MLRLHQEDMCQACGLPPETKYQEDGGPSLRKVAGILADVAAPRSRERLLQAVVLNCVLGNGDAHGKNFSLLHEPTGAAQLSPLYDLMCTLHYGDERLAMQIDEVTRTKRVTAQRIVNEATSWGMNTARASAIVTDLLARAPDAIAKAQAETDGLPDEIVQTVVDQMRRLTAQS